MTWNVNSLKARQERVEAWLAECQPDVVCMQETKLADTAFPAMAFSALGYESVHHGEGRWNGVSIISRVGLDDVVAGFGDGEPADDEARLVTATCGGVRVMSAYIPNGRALDHEHYQYKLAWLERLVGPPRRRRPTRPTPVALCGDFNIAPADRDVWDPAALVDATHVERAGAGRARSACSTGASPMCSATATPTRSGSSRGGTTAPATSTRASGCASTSCSARRRSPSACAGRSSTATPARASSPRTTPPSWSSWRTSRERRQPVAGRQLTGLGRVGGAHPGAPRHGAHAPPRGAVPRRRRHPRTCCTRMVQTSAPIEVIEEAADDVEQAAERFGGYTSKSMYEGFAEAANAGEPFGFFDHSPMLGQANPLAPPIRLWLDGDRILGTATFGAGLRGPARLRARGLRRRRLRRGARLDAVALRQPRA